MPGSYQTKADKDKEFEIVKGIKKRHKDWVFRKCEFCEHWMVSNGGETLHPLCEQDPKRLRALKRAPDPNQGSLL